MKKWLVTAAMMMASTFVQAADKTMTVYQDPNCGCCGGWVEHMRDAGFTVNVINTSQVVAVKKKLNVPAELSSCHTGVINSTGQIVEGHVPANVVKKLIANPKMKGVTAPGMPLNAPGMGELDGNLITFDLNGMPFSRD